MADRAAGSRAGRAAVLLGLATSFTALAVAPAVMPADYSWVSQTTSESGAQRLEGAWVARLGFLLFGLSVILLAALSHRRWGAWATGIHSTFGVLMTATAAFSHRPWQAASGYDQTEDLLHSVAATSMGVAFGVGVVAAALWAGRSGRRWRALDFLAVGAVALPLGMVAFPGGQGLIQRLIFVIAYAWYAVEAQHVVDAPVATSA
jgi:Protein of unknown function (DUF998)